MLKLHFIGKKAFCQVVEEKAPFDNYLVFAALNLKYGNLDSIHFNVSRKNQQTKKRSASSRLRVP